MARWDNEDISKATRKKIKVRSTTYAEGVPALLDLDGSTYEEIYHAIGETLAAGKGHIIWDYERDRWHEGDLDEFVHITRDETDTEMKERVYKARKARERTKLKKAEDKIKKEARDLAEYERLKKKFNG